MKGQFESARLLGLTISSAAVRILQQISSLNTLTIFQSKVVGITTPILIGLYAFRVARDWLLTAHKEASESDEDLPTPLQYVLLPSVRFFVLKGCFRYGLVVDLLSGSGLAALVQAVRYMTRSHRRRARASSMLSRSFLVILTIFVLKNVIRFGSPFLRCFIKLTTLHSAVDLWLHTVTATIILPTISPIDTPFQYSIAQNICPPYPDPWYEAIHPCLMTEGAWLMASGH